MQSPLRLAGPRQSAHHGLHPSLATSVVHLLDMEMLQSSTVLVLYSGKGLHPPQHRSAGGQVFGRRQGHRVLALRFEGVCVDGVQLGIRA